MSAPRRSFSRFVVLVVATAVAALSVSASGAAAPEFSASSVPASSIPASSAAALSSAAEAAAPRTCGGSHYPPCPPRSSISISHRTVHRGHKVQVKARHLAPHKTLTVHLIGHGRNFIIGKVKTDKHGNAEFSVRFPTSLKPGTYTLVFKIGSTTKRIHIVVKR